MVTFVLFVMVGMGMYAQYWRDQAIRYRETITYMVMEEVNEEENQDEARSDQPEE